MLKKIAVIIVLFFTLLGVVPVLAADPTSKIPELNPFCWRRKDCWVERAKYLYGVTAENPSESDKIELNKGFVSNKSVAPCMGGGDPEKGQDWGRCLPAGTSKTEIDFGGRAEFSNIGDFILVMYSYLVTVASILAVIMIIVSGVQWITSGGNSEAISSAKSRIGGAVIGLFIAFMSYFILNTINPNLINFRLPQVWLARPQYLIPQFCKDLEGAKTDKIRFSFYADEKDQLSQVDLAKSTKDYIAYENNDDSFKCGKRFLVDGGGTQTCFGDVCPNKPGERSMCTTFNEKTTDYNMRCWKGELKVTYRVDTNDPDLEEEAYAALGEIADGWIGGRMMTHEWLRPIDIKFWGVCNKGGLLYLANRGESLGTNLLVPEGAEVGFIEKWLGTKDSSKPFHHMNMTEKKPYVDYDVLYGSFTDDNLWNCDHGGDLVGFFLRNEVILGKSTKEKAWETLCLGCEATIPNLSIGYNTTTREAVYGVMADDVMGLRAWEKTGDRSQFKGFQNYIPLDDLRDGGLRLNVRLTIGLVRRLRGYSEQNPGNFYSLSDTKYQNNRLLIRDVHAMGGGWAAIGAVKDGIKDEIVGSLSELNQGYEGLVQSAADALNNFGN